MFHRDDIESSRRAAEGHTRSGKAASNKALVLDMVTRFPGHTAGEIAYCEMDVVEVRRRLFDLRCAHQVYRGEQRRCTRAGNLQATWYAS